MTPCLTARSASRNSIACYRGSFYPRSILLLYCGYRKICGYSNLADLHHTRENIIKLIGRYIFRTWYGRWCFLLSQIRRMNSHSFRKISYAICFGSSVRRVKEGENKNEKWFVICFIVGAHGNGEIVCQANGRRCVYFPSTLMALKFIYGEGKWNII